jgi:hypothetical protein
MPGIGRPPILAWRVVAVISTVIFVLGIWGAIDLASRLFK